MASVIACHQDMWTDEGTVLLFMPLEIGFI